MEDTCSFCGSKENVESTGDVNMCASCRGEKLEVTARLRFIRWAVEHGKITDFPGQVDELFEQSANGGSSFQ